STLRVPIMVDAYGEVCAASFTLEFDPAVFRDVTVELGADAAADSVLTVNSNESLNGRIAVLVDSPGPIAAGGGKTLVVVRLVRFSDEPLNATEIRITDGIAKIGLSDASGNDLAVQPIGKAIN
ncbi:MAG: cohesin domain-containing protein, partial [Pyrinomonadaceae bacterium]